MLHGDQQSFDLVHVAPVAQRIVQDRPHDGIGVDDKHGPHRLGAAGGRLEHAESLGHLHRQVADDREVHLDAFHALVLDLLFDRPQPRDVAERLSMDNPSNLQLSFSNSGCMEAKIMNSVVQTGVKSAGCEKKTTHLPLKSSGKLMGPWVVSALNDGAFSPINGSLFSLHIGNALSAIRLDQNGRGS
jgi:hypothetical protein